MSDWAPRDDERKTAMLEIEARIVAAILAFGYMVAIYGTMGALVSWLIW